MHIYYGNNPAKFHTNPIWNDRALHFLDQVEEWSSQQLEEQDTQHMSWSKNQ